jgi:hypothetical protein
MQRKRGICAVMERLQRKLQRSLRIGASASQKAQVFVA